MNLIATNGFGEGVNGQYAEIDWSKSKHVIYFNVEVNDTIFDVKSYNVINEIDTYCVNFDINSYNTQFNIETHDITFNAHQCK